MSARALLLAVQARLRSSAVLNDLPAETFGKVCGIQPDGRPPPGFGQIYYAVHWLGSRDRGEETTADEVDLEHSVGVTVTARLGVAPTDRQGKKITDAGDLIDLAEALVVPSILDGEYTTVTVEANKLIPGTAEYVAINGGVASTNGFIEPLQLLAIGPVEEKGASWVRAAGSVPDVFAIGIRFGRARRLQVKG